MKHLVAAAPDQAYTVYSMYNKEIKRMDSPLTPTTEPSSPYQDIDDTEPSSFCRQDPYQEYSEQARLQESDSTPTPKKRCLREIQEEGRSQSSNHNLSSEEDSDLKQESAFDPWPSSNHSLSSEEDSDLKQEESAFDLLSQSPTHSLTPYEDSDEDSCLKQEEEIDDSLSQKDATDLEKEQQESDLQSTPRQSIQVTPKPSLHKMQGAEGCANTGPERLTEPYSSKPVYTPKRTRQYTRQYETKVLMTSTDTDTDTGSDRESEYFPTPLRQFKIKLPALPDIPNNCTIAEMRQVDSFIQKVSRGCKRTGCRGGLIPVEARTQQMGGAARIIYRCKRCSKYYTFDSAILPDHPTTRQSKLSRALQVAFITAGCTHATYRKVLDILGMAAVSFPTFMQTIRDMHPVVEEMVEEMCSREKERMKNMSQEQLGSWTRAVTTADGVWHTRGFFSKNSTFTIRNYFNGALLYFIHLCQKGRDHIIEEPLYKGTSKSTEGYSATQLMNVARTEGLNIEVHWQDGDSSSSKRVLEVFPGAKIMLCGGHAAKSHLKLLMVRGKQKKFTAALQDREKKFFPEVVNVECHCKSKNCKAGCGCLTDVFCQRSRNSFSTILSTCESASDFSRRLSHLTHHVQDEHQWEEEQTCEKHYLTTCKECEFESDGVVARQCDFHPLTLCNCGECADKNHHECEGKLYRTKEVLRCPFHLLAYKIECLTRTKMADKLVHPILKRGHSNWLESSHSVLIRFRQKHVFLERLHYIVSTNLGLLQANMTHEYQQQGADYHWKTELYKKLNLPLYEGVQEVLSKQNQQRKKVLDGVKTEKTKKRRVQLKKLRVIDRQQRILWTDQHGRDTYGTPDGDDSDIECYDGVPDEHDVVTTDSDDSDVECYDGVPDEHNFVTSDGDAHSDHEIPDEHVSECNCNTLTTAHKHISEPHINDRTNAAQPEPQPEPQINDRTNATQPHINEPPSGVNTDCGNLLGSNLDKTDRLEVGMYVYLHSSRFGEQHLLCRIAKKVGNLFRLYCGGGILNASYSPEVLTISLSDSNHSLSLGNWRTSPKISLAAAALEAACLAKCKCVIPKPVVVDISEDDGPTTAATSEKVWMENCLYKLTIAEKEEVVSSCGWLNDRVITAAQLLMLQHSPLMEGLQPPTLAQRQAFDCHKDQIFVQIIIVGNSHWCVVSNVGCDEGTVNVYDTIFARPSNITVRVVCSLVSCSTPTLSINMMDVQRQSNGSDCGVLAIAIAFELCCHRDPCIQKFGNTVSIRSHLARCLEDCKLTTFSTGIRRCRNRVKFSKQVEIACLCREPKDKQSMVKCKNCKAWFHKHCCRETTQVVVPWACTFCRN
ncbi:uncharacterized protein LOC135335416 isoform X2 [Halichondria panicea]|uniref:uncharacterized protein LOC135335416 isoform X2 n=1 Tax=Halichondria panicea TaxID=6063 RepID=UPI00312B5D48